MKRWLVAAVALALGGAVSAALLFLSSPSRGAIEVVVAAQDLGAGAVLDSSSIALTELDKPAAISTLFTVRDEGSLIGLHATHALVAGQLIQRSDVGSPGSAADSRLVFVPVKDAPAVPPGSRVDLLAVTGQPDHPLVEPFALDVEVAASSSSGLVVAVPAGEAAAFVYAGAAMQLAAVVAEAGASSAPEVPVSSDQQAIDIAGAAPS